MATLIQPIAVVRHAVSSSNLHPGQLELVSGNSHIGLAVGTTLKGHQAGKIVVTEPALDRRVMTEKIGNETINQNNIMSKL